MTLTAPFDDLKPHRSLLECTQLGCRRGERTLFSGLSFGVEAGGALRIDGANGAGKSSLLRLLCGLSAPDSGSVSWQGEPVSAAAARHRARVLYLGHAAALKEDLSASENLRYSGVPGRRVERPAALAALDRMGLGAHADVPVRQLSQGQRRRAALARLALADDRPLWLLDEPFVALDDGGVRQVRLLTDQHRSRGGIVIYTTHEHTLIEGAVTLSLHGAVAPAC